MAEIVLRVNQIDEIGLRIDYLRETFRALSEVGSLRMFTALLMDADHKVGEIQAIIDGKNIIRRNDETVFGIN